MGIFSKFSTLLRSNINDLIARAENPEKMLNQIIIDMREQLTKAKQEVAVAIADERKLKAQAEEEAKQAQEWGRRAMLAVREGRDDLARQALLRQQEYEEIKAGMWVLQAGNDGARLVLHYSPPLLLLRTKVMEVPAEDGRCAELFRRLLELNATDLVHGAYGIEEGDVILTDTLELENLDFNEVQASVDSIQVALASHFDTLSPYRACEGL